MSRDDVQTLESTAGVPIRFQVWGARGSKNAVGSAIGNRTSCYSLLVGEDLFIFDAGSGLVAMSAAQRRDPEMAQVRRVHILITHAHLDHWEGLKDAEWLWDKGCGVELTVLAPRETLDTIDSLLCPPLFVKLEILALGTVKSLDFVELAPSDVREWPGMRLDILKLNHYSGMPDNKRMLDTNGYRLSIEGGPTVAYLCDHEPTEETRAMEDATLAASDLAIIDASYCHVSQHAFGHGSIESAADMARRYPEAQVLAGHHGAMQEDETILAAFDQHGSDVGGLQLARDGMSLDWDPAAGRFVPTPS